METIFKNILTIDQELLLFINGLHSPFGDILMWHFSDKLFWIPLYAVLLALLIKKLGLKKGLLCIFLVVLLILTADQLGATLIRPNIGRLRPSSSMNPLSGILHFVNDSRGGDFGFPSCHAANTFALAVFISLILKTVWIRYGLLIWAILVSGSRIYLGLHYPTDIIAGAFLGICVGYNFYVLFNFLLNLKFSRFLRNYTNFTG